VIVAGDPEAVRTSLDRVLFPADRVRLGAVTPAVLHQPLGEAPAEAQNEAAESATAAGTWPVRQDAQGWQLGDALLLPADAPLPAWLTERRPLEPQEQEHWRLQQGLPAAPGEINDETNPFELGLVGRVSLSKGCYVGQETLAKLATYDGVKRQLRRWHGTAAASPAPAAGMSLQDAAGGRAGVITSCLERPDGAGWIGLALVRRGALQETALFTAAAAGAPLHLSVPPAFQSPPVGAGGRASS
jgi:folate-binding protein YgfZ